MRTSWIAAMLLAGVALAPPAAAQRVLQNGRWVVLPPRTPPSVQPIIRPDRWGGQIDGRWYAGARAPGGWRAYRRPSRGWTLPGYWMADSFRIPDYLSFGLAAPPYGYFWVRYYDDAVLVDAQGRVWDSVDGIAWAGASASSSSSYSWSQSQASAGASYPPPGAPIRPIDPNQGYYPEPPVDQEPIPAPGPVYPGGGGAPPAPGMPPAVQVQPCPNTCPGAIYYGGSGYAASSGYYGSGYYSGPTTTTVTIQSVPVTTTTTTVEEEVVEDRTTTTYVRPRRVIHRARPVHRKVYKPRCVCTCNCCCR